MRFKLDIEEVSELVNCFEKMMCILEADMLRFHIVDIFRATLRAVDVKRQVCDRHWSPLIRRLRHKNCEDVKT